MTGRDSRRKSPASRVTGTLAMPVNTRWNSHDASRASGAVGAAVAPQRDHDVVARAPLRDQFGDHFGRVLQVGVDGHGSVAAHVVEPAGQRDLLAEIARQADDLDARIGMAQRHELGEGFVGAAVIDEDHLGRQREPRPARRTAAPRMRRGPLPR